MDGSSPFLSMGTTCQLSLRARHSLSSICCLFAPPRLFLSLFSLSPLSTNSPQWQRVWTQSHICTPHSLRMCVWSAMERSMGQTLLHLACTSGFGISLFSDDQYHDCPHFHAAKLTFVVSQQQLRMIVYYSGIFVFSSGWITVTPSLWTSVNPPQRKKSPECCRPAHRTPIRLVHTGFLFSLGLILGLFLHLPCIILAFCILSRWSRQATSTRCAK